MSYALVRVASSTSLVLSIYGALKFGWRQNQNNTKISISWRRLDPTQAKIQKQCHNDW